RRRRARGTPDLRRGEDATCLLFTGRPLDLRPTEPPQYLPDAGERGAAAARHSFPGIDALPRGADPVSRRALPGVLSAEGRFVAVADDWGGRRRRRALAPPPPRRGGRPG